jgi:hypothetical protein
LLAEDSKQKL